MSELVHPIPCVSTDTASEVVQYQKSELVQNEIKIEVIIEDDPERLDILKDEVLDENRSSLQNNGCDHHNRPVLKDLDHLSSEQVQA